MGVIIFDILYETEENENYFSCDDIAVNGLLLKETFSFFAKDEYVNDFIDVIKVPLLNQKNILFRRTIFNDFINEPNLLYGMVNFLNDLKKFVDEQKYDVDILKYKGSITSIQAGGILIKKLLLMIKKSSKALLNFKPQSEALDNILTFLSYFSKIDSDPIFQFCTNLENASSESAYRVKTRIDDMGVMSYSSVMAEDKSKPQKIERRGFFRKQSNNTEQIRIYIGNEVLTSGLGDLTTALKNVYNLILKKFSKLEKQIFFYYTAYKYWEHINKIGLPLTYPEISENICFENLYDIFLLQKTQDIVPHSFTNSEK